MAAGIMAATLSATAGASAEGITLKVFGGSSLDQLAPRQTPEEQKKIQDEVFKGFLAKHPEVSAIDWDAQGPQANSLQRLMTAKLASQEIDLIACPAFWTNGAYVRRGLLRPITDDIKPFADRVDAAALCLPAPRWLPPAVRLVSSTEFPSSVSPTVGLTSGRRSKRQATRSRAMAEGARRATLWSRRAAAALVTIARVPRPRALIAREAACRQKRGDDDGDPKA